jgi:ATP-dependent helicase/nuclease subunit A
MAAENDEEMAEHSRLLYVATTRAADYLILSAGVEDLDKPTGPWMELLAKRFNLTKGTMSRGGEEERGRGGNSTTDSQSPSLPLSHSPLSLVRVTTSEPPIQIKPVDPHRRRDLMKTVEKAQQMAADGQGKRPQYLAPVACDPGARRQYSFSRLTGKLHAKTSGIDAGSLEAESPAEPPLDARGLGTLVHAVLAEIDFVRPGDVEELVRRLAPQHLARSERDCPNFRGHRRAAMVDENGTVPFVACEMLRGFLVSPRAEQLASAKEVHAEIEFLLAWPPGDRQPGGRFLQGFIDCLFLDAAGQWRLIDYKTNRGVTAETLAEKAAPYEMQMLVYALAAETILKTPPVELALCFLQPGLEYRYAWDEPARQHVVELVNAALP